MRNPVKLLAKYGSLFLGAVFLTMLLTWGLVKVFDGDKYVKDKVLPTVVSDRPEEGASDIGGDHLDYYNPADKIPEGFDEEQDATPIQLLAERQSKELPVQEVPASERAQLAEFTTKFLTEWEGFTGGEGYASYSSRLAPYVVPSRLEATAQRLSNRSAREIGPCKACTSGSVLDTSRLSPGDYMVVRRIDDETAYITTQGMVTYTGVSIYTGKTVRRTYALLLERSGSTWRVERVVAETLKYA